MHKSDKCLAMFSRKWFLNNKPRLSSSCSNILSKTCHSSRSDLSSGHSLSYNMDVHSSKMVNSSRTFHSIMFSSMVDISTCHCQQHQQMEHYKICCRS
jgi:hypothetical protein